MERQRKADVLFDVVKLIRPEGYRIQVYGTICSTGSDSFVTSHLSTNLCRSIDFVIQLLWLNFFRLETIRKWKFEEADQQFRFLPFSIKRIFIWALNMLNLTISIRAGRPKFSKMLLFLLVLRKVDTAVSLIDVFLFQLKCAFNQS